MNDAINAGTLAPCPFCGGCPHMADTGVSWVICDDCGSEGPPGDNDPDATAKWNTRASTPKATVEREAIARIIDPMFRDALALSMAGHRTERALAKADAILARLDEAAIRADQREIDAKIADEMAAEILNRSRVFNPDGMVANTLKANSELVVSAASAIRNGGKQP